MACFQAGNIPTTNCAFFLDTTTALQQNPANFSRGDRVLARTVCAFVRAREKFRGNRAVLAWLDRPVHQCGMPCARALVARGSGAVGPMQQLRCAIAPRAATVGAADEDASADARVVPAVAASLSGGNARAIWQADARRIARRRKVPAAHVHGRHKRPPGDRRPLCLWRIIFVEKK